MNVLITHLVLILLILLAQARTSINIIGQWENAETYEITQPSEPPPHIKLEFYRDGSFVLTFSTSSEGAYEVSGNDILVKPINSDSAETEKFSLKVEGNTLTLTTNGEEMKLKRLSNSSLSDLPFVGRWGIKTAAFHGGNNGLWEVLLTRDGRITFKLQAEPERGRYKIKGNLLTMNGRSYRVRFEEGLMILKPVDEDELERKYKRTGKG